MCLGENVESDKYVLRYENSFKSFKYTSCTQNYESDLNVVAYRCTFTFTASIAVSEDYTRFYRYIAALLRSPRMHA